MKLHLADCIPSAHFLEKKESRGVGWDTIRNIVENPSVIEPAGFGRKRYARGGLAIVVAPPGAGKPAVLITILLRQQGQWTDEDVIEHGRKNHERAKA